MAGNCWDVMNCPEDRMKACPAFTQEKGKDCWTVAGTRCKGEVQGTMVEKYYECRLCTFYQFANRVRFGIGAKLFAGFAAVVLLLVLVGAIAFYQGYAYGAIDSKGRGMTGEFMDGARNGIYRIAGVNGVMNGLVEFNREGFKDNAAKASRGLAAVAIILAMAALVALTVMLLIARSLVKPLQALEAATVRVALCDFTGDLVQVRSKDEIGRLTLAFNQITASTRDIVMRLKEKAAVLDAAARQLTESNSQTSAATENAAAVSQISTTLETITSNATDVAAAAEAAAEQALAS